LDENKNIQGTLAVMMKKTDKKSHSKGQQDQSVKSKRKKTTEHYLIKIFESLPGRAYIKDKNGIYLMCNKELIRDCGFSSPRDLVGKTDYDLPSKEQADLLRKVDIQVMESGQPLILEEPGTHMDGTPAVYRTRKIPIKDDNGNIMGIFGLSDDITQEKKVEVANKELEDKIKRVETERFKGLMKITQGHFYWKNKAGVYLDCNDAVAKAAGFESAKDIIGKTDHDVLSKDEADILHATDLRIMTSGVPEILEEPGIRADGSLGIFMTSKFPSYDMNGNIDSIIGFSNDITIQKQAEIAKTDFISNMEHDLRTPFAGISGIATTLYEIEDDPEKKEMLELLVKSCSQWEETHHSILAALSVKEPQLIKKERFSIFDELTAIKDAFVATVHLKNLDFSIESFAAECDEIETDRLKFRLILSSLIGNAINFTEKGSVKVIIDCEKSEYKIQVIDTGIGIPEDKLEYIFEQFTKLSRSNKHGGNFKGVGLGLYISRLTAQQLGGTLTAMSQIGNGSTFILRLPRETKTK
jgi:PAS domain S-box-containing protein